MTSDELEHSENEDNDEVWKTMCEEISKSDGEVTFRDFAYVYMNKLLFSWNL